MKFRKTGIKVSALHIVFLLIFAMLLGIMLDITGIPSIWYLSQYGTVTEHIADNEVNLIPFNSFLSPIPAERNDNIKNIIFFIPFGFFLPILWQKYHKIGKTVFTGFLFSFAIEFSQLFDHRSTDIDDLIMNTAGALSGWFLWRIFKKIIPFHSKKTPVTNTCELPFMFRYEDVFCILSAFLGIFFLRIPNY